MLLQGVASAQTQAHEEFTLIGWGDSCSAALQVLRFPGIGADMEGIPIWGEIAILSLPADKSAPQEKSVYSYDGKSEWNADEANRVVDHLIRSGYSDSKLAETVRPDAIASRPGLELVIRSTAAFESPDPIVWPPPPFSLFKVFYAPLGNCALAVFQRPSASDAFRWRILRTNPSSRRVRARAHVTNGLLIYKDGDLDGGQAETQIAADMDPDYAAARFYNSTLLAAQGRIEDSLAELKAALDLDPALAKKAPLEVDFKGLLDDPRFVQILRNGESRR